MDLAQMNFFQMNVAAMLVGLLLDLLIGDPEGWPHPVIWIGRYISFMERRLRARGGNLRRRAPLLTLSTVAIAMCATALALGLCACAGRWLCFAAMCAVSWTAISARCLAREAKGVAAALRVSIERGRKQVARIVGRDTTALTEREIICATVETVAENTTDGVIAPMLYLALGGPVLAMGFKAASTLDSMVGYLDEKYRDIGWSSAKLDDALNYLPARICGLLMCLAAGILRMSGRSALRVLRRDHANHLSPNCAWSEAAAAGALGIRLGGAHAYFGKIVEKPTIGDDLRAPEEADILRMNRLMYATTALAALLIALIGGLL